MRTMERTWNLYRSSFAVLTADIEIVLFPILSTISAMLIAAGFLYSLYHSGALYAITHKKTPSDDYGTLFLWYYLNYLVVIFFNAALVACANKRLSGENPTVRDGLRIACSRFVSIAVWAFVSATFGMILSVIRDRRNPVASLLGLAIGLSWTLITYLVIPVIVIEQLSVGNAINRSSQLFRQNWGEQVAGDFGFGLITLAFCLPALLVAVLCYPLNPLFAVILGTVYLLLLMMICSAVKGVFTVALYRHASAGQLPAGFSEDLINGALGGRRGEPGVEIKSA